ncbi:DUF6493 family protein [Roseibium sp. MMSF_3544]|uniref:DUF6493 family protein n=1 Tax=unclassified Roseibium TaxID=2629323 RepID=UPI00273D74CF|nr:DUF6493 family protein [Roseibium sp. MMSF_3544]
MNDEEFLSILTRNKARAALDALAAIPASERRKHAKAVAKLYTDHVLFGFQHDKSKGKKPRDPDAVVVGLFATATLSEFKKLGYVPIPSSVPIEDVFNILALDWAQGLVDYEVENNPHAIGAVAPLWQNGLASRPESDAIILGYYGLWHERWGIDEEVLLSRDVWRFFEVEGSGEFSLANHDKFAKQGMTTWSARLINYAAEGRLDRQRLLDASLDALDRDFGQYRAGWYSRFHSALEPTEAEIAARAERYISLLSSSVPPTVSFALKYVQALEKVSALEPAHLLSNLEPVLQARAKGPALAALKLVEKAAKRDASISSEAAHAASLALVSEDPGVQGKALDLIEKLDQGAREDVRAVLSDYVDLVAPSVRTRIATMVGTTTQQVVAEDVLVPDAPAVPPILPVNSAQEAFALFLKVLEAPRDPFEVERAVDGISRFGVELRKDETVLSPLKKRARQVWKKPGDTEIRAVLALTGLALSEGTAMELLRREEDNGDYRRQTEDTRVQSLHLARNAEMTDRVLAGSSLPLLSLPSDSSGTVSASQLLARLAEYHRAGETPGIADLSLALMRLGGEDRSTLEDLPRTSEAERAVAYAMGQDVDVGPTPELWAAAWCARRPIAEDKRVVSLFEKPLPDCGIAAKMKLNVIRKESPGGDYFWVKIEVPITPELSEESNMRRSAPVQSGANRSYPLLDCGHSFADVAWASLVRPAAPDLFFRQAMLHQDVWQKLTDNHTRAYLEPFFRPGPDVGPLGAGVLAYYMAVEDKSVTSLAGEAAVSLLSEGRLATTLFAEAVKTFMLSGALPTTRWTKGFAAMAQAGASAHVREAIAFILDFPAEQCPRDMGGMLELFYELHVAAGTAPDRPETVACLKSIPGGGKVSKFSSKLLSLAKQAA